MSEGNCLFEGDCLPPGFWPSKVFAAMPTAIIEAYTSEGFAAIADGLSTNERKERLRNNNQKIFPVNDSGRSLVYMLYGVTRLTGPLGLHPVLDLAFEAQRTAVELARHDLSNLLGYATKFCGRLRDALADCKGQITYPCSAPEPEPGRFSILKVLFSGYYRGLPARADVNITHHNGVVSIDPTNPRVKLECRILGSEKVAKALLRDRFDPRLADYRIPAMEKGDADLTLNEAIGIGASYIRACDSKVGHEIDPDFAPTIGGRTHAVTITERDGARFAPGYELLNLAG